MDNPKKEEDCKEADGANDAPSMRATTDAAVWMLDHH